MSVCVCVCVCGAAWLTAVVHNVCGDLLWGDVAGNCDLLSPGRNREGELFPYQCQYERRLPTLCCRGVGGGCEGVKRGAESVGVL